MTTVTRIINITNRIIEYSFYLLFFLVPLVFTGDTSELFELNKMWITFVITIVIATSWIIKMICQRQFKIQRTPLDIPIALFLLSQILSTVFSIDRHISLWGYYSRFNGGLFSIISYVVLYYAFVSNFKENIYAVTKKLILVTLSSGLIVALWGLPSRFGYDPTCLIFRGTFDVSCWTADFQPKIRIFSTIGQPAWLAAYLAYLIPVTIALFIKNGLEAVKSRSKLMSKQMLTVYLYLALTVLFYIDLVFSNTRAATLGLWLAIAGFVAFYFWLETKGKISKEKLLTLDFKLLASSLIVIFLLTFFLGQPFQQLNLFTFQGVKDKIITLTNKTATKSATQTATPPVVGSAGEIGITDSGNIRKFVWEGAINSWKSNPIFGTGVETFAFAYYKTRPAGHNLTSEWRYLYNKAHNEYLNYLTTTGSLGIVTYLSIIGLFLYLTVKYLLKSPNEKNKLLILAFIAGYTTILITNFFGFSVVIINIFFFFTPVFVFVLAGMIDFDKKIVFAINNNQQKETDSLRILQKILISVFCFIAIFSIYKLFAYWNADRAYALGYNYDRAGAYNQAYSYLTKAVQERPGEPVFKDELAVNSAALAVALISQKDQQGTQSAVMAQNLAEQAIVLSDEVTTNYPNNVVFWKSRVRILYTLSQINQSYLPLALEAIKTTANLAPTDAEISYNMGVLYGQTDKGQKAIETLEQTIKLKPDYVNAYYALGIFYRQMATDKSGKITNTNYQQKAVDIMEKLLKISPDNEQAKDALKTWGK